MDPEQEQEAMQNKVQEENLVDDQIAEAISDTAAVAAGIGGTTPAPVAPAAPAVDTAEPDDAPLIAAPTAVPAAPAAEDAPEPETTEPEVNEPEEAPMPTIKPAHKIAVPTPVSAPMAPAADKPVSEEDQELMDVKKKALEQLSPLVRHLDLPPEQRFVTYMEIIRASDDRSLVQPAFEAAQGIEDDDKKAQALLDVVNEVNYLTQASSDK